MQQVIRIQKRAAHSDRSEVPPLRPDADVKPARIALVIAFSEGSEERLPQTIDLAPHSVDIYASPQSAGREGANGKVVVPAHYQRKFRSYDYVAEVRHPLVGADEIRTALGKLAQSDVPMYVLIPGLNELVTTGLVALAVFDMRKPDVRRWFPSVPYRMRKRIAPYLPVKVKSALWAGYFMLQRFAVPLSGRGKGAVQGAGQRISTQRSVAAVLERENPSGLPLVYSLGGRELQKLFFVGEVPRRFPLPSTISLVLSNQCNLKCVMCPYHSPLYIKDRRNDYFDSKRWMPVKLVRRMVEELRPINEAPITFHMGELDEPLMHPDIAEIVSLLSTVPHATVHITSNGNLMSESLARSLVAGGLKSIQFSVDAQTPETYKKIRGAKLEKVQRNVRQFLKVRDEMKPDLYANLCIISQGDAANEIEDFKAYWRKHGASSVSVYQLFEPDRSSPERWQVRNKYFAEQERTPCTALWDQCVVYPEGEVSLCCTTLIRVPQDGIMSVGNINRSSLREIWLGEQYRRLREDMIDNRLDDHPYCQDCDNWSSSYQFKKRLEDGTIFIYGESMGYYFFPERNPTLS